MSSCKKYKPPTATPGEGLLEISFDGTTIEPSLADSVVVVFTKVNSNQPILKRLRSTNGKWITEINDLSAGDWTAELNFYARSGEPTDYGKRLFIKTKSFSIAANTPQKLVLKAPNGKFADDWKTYLLLVDSENKVSVVVSANGIDPHLQVRTPEFDDYYYYIERNAYHTVNGSSQSVASFMWECDNNCNIGNSRWLISETIMQPYAQQLQNKNWNIGELFIIVINIRTGKESVFFYLYNKNWFL